MDTQQQQQNANEVAMVLRDLADLLKGQGKSDEEIDKTISSLFVEVEMAVVDEIVQGLPEDKQKQLAEMEDAQKSPEEIAEVLNLDPQKADEIEMRKFEEIVGEFINSLDEQK